MTMTGDSPARLAEDLKRYFEQLLEDGVEWCPGDPASLERELTVPARARESSASPASGPSRDELRRAYLQLRDEACSCRKCRLAETRRHVVFGEGRMRRGVLFVGEGPGANEDKTGRPFVGRAGGLLDKMLAAIGLTRSDVYITNIVKCRPPGNRDPKPDEIVACWSFLEAQLKLLKPRVIVALGAPAAKTLLETGQGIGRLRGRFHRYEGLPLLPTYHPAYILRSYTPENRRKAYEDLKLLRAFLDGKRSLPGG